MEFHFKKEQLSDFQANIRKEWAMTNGLGGYAGGSVTGACNRTHQGYLIASLHSPVERFLILSKTNERFVQNRISYDLETSQHLGPIYREGQRYLTDFIYNGNVTFVYQAGDLEIRKQLVLVHGQNTVAIDYEITNSGEVADFTITPLFNYREHSASSTREDLHFSHKVATSPAGKPYGLVLKPEKNPNIKIGVAFSAGILQERTELYDENMQYQTEVDNEVDGLDSHYTPYDIVFPVPAHGSMHFSLICSVADGTKDFPHISFYADTARLLADTKLQYLNGLLVQAGYGQDEFANTLVIAADQFLANRASTGLKTVLAGLPWFTDWGRDTMIAFSGLTLATRRFQEAREILVTFAKYIRHGLVPNMFPDDGQEPLYNTVDASLWYFYAVDQYLRYTGDSSDYLFVERELYPALQEIIRAYQNGTDFSIYMEEDGLIHAGSGLDQVTWMDVRVGDWVATPRHGKPVEINALWYNALMVMAGLAEQYHDDAIPYRDLASTVRKSFLEQFWNEADQCLYDVVDGDMKDASIRPNQIYAVSLPHSMLGEEQAAKVVDTVQTKLVAGPGIRSLSPDHKDYHPIYLGALQKRDEAYHQGTAWGFLMGGFITAYAKVHGHTPEAKKQALAFLEPVREHLYKGCIGSISEIFDGDSPHTCRGCYAQAWSVGEVLRCYVEDILD